MPPDSLGKRTTTQTSTQMRQYQQDRQSVGCSLWHRQTQPDTMQEQRRIRSNTDRSRTVDTRKHRSGLSRYRQRTETRLPFRHADPTEQVRQLDDELAPTVSE